MPCTLYINLHVVYNNNSSAFKAGCRIIYLQMCSCACTKSTVTPMYTVWNAAIIVLEQYVLANLCECHPDIIDSM